MMALNLLGSLFLYVGRFESLSSGACKLSTDGIKGRLDRNLSAGGVA